MNQANGASDRNWVNLSQVTIYEYDDEQELNSYITSTWQNNYN